MAKFTKWLIRLPSQYVAAVLLGLLISTSVLGAPLTDEHIMSAEKILIMPGTFDPISNGHIRSAQLALKEAAGTLVIILPTSQPLHKQTLPFDTRLQLIETALSGDSQLTYPSRGHWRAIAAEGSSLSQAFYQRIRQMNPKAQISLVVGQDTAEKLLSYVLLASRPDEIIVIPRDADKVVKPSPLLAGQNIRILKEGVIGISSSRVRDFLQRNFDLYLGPHSDALLAEKLNELSTILPDSVAAEIFERGLYLDRGRSNLISPFALVKTWLSRKFVKALFAVGFYDDFKSLFVSMRAQSERTEVVINEKSYPVQRHLGSGMSADAYLIEVEGRDVAVKIARNADARLSILRSIPVHLWAQQKFGIQSPRLIDYDPQGRWLMTEFIRGTSVSDYLLRNGELPEGVRRSILNIHRKALQMADQSFIGLDFAPDNLVIRGGEAYLVDLGPVPQDARLRTDGNTLLARWERKFGSKQNRSRELSQTGAPTCRALFAR